MSSSQARFATPRLGTTRRFWALVAATLAVMAVAFVAGGWQYSRHEARVARNDAVAFRSAGPAVPLTDLLPPGPGQAPPGTEWRRVSAAGRYDPAGTVVVRNRTVDGNPGDEVLVPLLLDDGTAVLLDRGWQPASRPVRVPDPPAGRVEIVGRVRQGEALSDPDRLGRSDGPPVSVSRLDPALIAGLLPHRVRAGYVELAEENPAAGGLQRIQVPKPSIGPHLAYAVQWYALLALAPVGLAVVLRREHSPRSPAVPVAHAPGRSDQR